ncbi:MAG: hypothetical protein AAF702_01100 [Chloroflexota bacterium]
MLTLSETRRPFGVTAIVLLQILSCIVLIVVIYLNWDRDVHRLYERLTRPADLPLLIGYGSTIFGAIVAPGLWRLRRWAWVLTMIQLGLRMGTGIFAYIIGEAQYFQMFVNVITVFYLNQRDVQRAFGHADQIGITVSETEE